MNCRIIQRKSEKSRFLPLKREQILPEDYRVAWQGEIEGENAEQALEELFAMFGWEKLENFPM